MKLEILETSGGFYFINHDKFRNIINNPYVALAKKEMVIGLGKVKFDILDFIELIDSSWDTEGRDEKVKIINVGKAADYRHEMTSVLIWEGRNINSNGDDRKGLWCMLTMSSISKEIYDRIRQIRRKRK